ncbi:glycosyltransferase family 4 protein [Pontiellaceae bacterium B12219]|nr:glycosyltransferase family 4 protein [Pontiellaceae bacterium B12219]
MRVLHICQRDDPDSGGSLRVAEALVVEQRRSGVDAWLLFLYGPPANICELLASGTKCLGLVSSKEALWGVPRLRAAIWEIKPDIIHFHDGIIWPRLAVLLCRTPVVMHTHLPPGGGSALSRFLVKKTTRLFFGISLPTIDAWVAENVRPSRIQYIPNGVDFDRFIILEEEKRQALRRRLNLPENKKILLWVGRLHQAMKGSDRVEKVANLLPEGYVLVVVGNGPEYEGMLERGKYLIEQKKLLLVGSAAMPERYYQAADQFLFTSYHEPFGLVILEAVASGLPILNFPVNQGGGAVKLLRDFNAIELRDGLDRSELEEALGLSWEQIPEQASRREKVMKEYSWTTLNRKVEDAYSLMLKRRVF